MLSEASTLMYPVEAMNHRKSGFFPTDNDTLQNLFSVLMPSDKSVNLLDPCCGEGDALSQFKDHIYPNAHTFGVELNQERYEVAKEKLDNAYYADIYDVSLGCNQFDLLFLNPPYGNDLTDNFGNENTERLEHKFLTQTFSALKADGVLMYIVPSKSIDEPRIKWLLARFRDVTIHKAAVDKYKQVVVIGIKLKHQRSVNAKMVEEFKQQANNVDVLPRIINPSYGLPGSSNHAKVRVNRLNEVSVAEVIKNYSGQWLYFDTLFTNVVNEFRQPMHSLSQWHTALLITSGAVQGEVTNQDGSRSLFIKGTVKKHKKVSQTSTEDDSGNVTVEVQSRERFSAQIKAIDITPNSPSFGSIITIK